MNFIEALARDILRAGRDDWVPLAAVDGYARQLGAETDEQARGIGMAAIRELVTADLVELGDVTDGGFFPWDLPAEVALERIEGAWHGPDRNEWGFACWLRNTPHGDELARGSRS
ncbi:MAG TPA: hypothetical protein VF486_21325 [Actinomycetes bacterium]